MFTATTIPAPAAPQSKTASPISQPFLPRQDRECLSNLAQSAEVTIEPPARRRSGRNIRKREFNIRQIIARHGMRLEKLGKDQYQLFSERLNEVCLLFDGVPLKAVERYFEEAQAQPLARPC